MERDANYVAVGAFTLLMMAMAAAFVMWYSDSGDARRYTNYEIYFNGSVAGLTPGSPVRYLGVDVGSVKRISLSADRPNSVKVVASVDTAAPITAATRASLGLQGITGLLYINLKEIPDSTSSELKTGDRFPVIESQSSDIDAFIASLPQLALRITTLVDNINGVFSSDNVKSLSVIMNNLKTTSDGLPQTRAELDKLLVEFRSTSAQIKSLAASFDSLATQAQPEVQQALANLNKVSAQLSGSTEKLDRMMGNAEAPLNQFTEQGLFEMQRMLRDARSAASELRDLSRSLKETPSQLMFERREAGVEIKP